MSEWMLFAVIILGIISITSCVHKWIDAKITVERILREELEERDDQDNSEDR